MSSTYDLICLSHPEAVNLGGDWHSGRGGREIVEARLRDHATELLVGHTGHDVIGGRYSYPLIEVYDPPKPDRLTGEWVSAIWLALALAAHDLPDIPPEMRSVLWYIDAHERWQIERLAPLRLELGRILTGAIEATTD